MSLSILSDYLGAIARIGATRPGTGEISYYGALAAALNSREMASGEGREARRLNLEPVYRAR